jgi:S-adenosylmethionine:tRNA ribosyltransferase-isomerase
MRTGDFDYSLPPDLIAQTPIEPRDHSRLMVLDRTNQSLEYRHFYNLITYLRPGDVLVFNDSRVIPARLDAQKFTGARIEILLLQRLSPGVWQALVRPARRLQIGTRLLISDPSPPNSTPINDWSAEVIGVLNGGIRVLHITNEEVLSVAGRIALPPYIRVPLDEPERYQTVYSRIQGSVAAPTAGLHFTKELLQKLEIAGVNCVFVTLHVGLDTFQPVREDDPIQHQIHREYAMISADTALVLSRAKADGRRIICVGTTVVRLLEAAEQTRCITQGNPFSGWVDLFILPGYRFTVVDAMITNFHLPRTTLLMLVSAFAGRDRILHAYQEAIKAQYRFYSFGDAMLIL